MVGQINFGALSPGFSYAQAIQSAGQGQQQQDQQTQNAIQKTQLTRQSAADARAETLRQASAAAVNPDGTIDPAKATAAYAQSGDLTGAMSIQDHIAATKKAQFDLAKTQNDALVQTLGGVKDQATYEQAKAHAAQLGIDPAKIASLPASYDPATVGQLQTSALTVQQQIAAQQEAAKFAYQQKHDTDTLGVTMRGQDITARTAAKGQAVTMRGQDLTHSDSAASLAQKTAQASNSLLDAPTVTAMAQQALSGDKSVFTGLGRGTQGAANIAAVRAEMTRQMQSAGMTGAQIAAKNAEYVGTQAAARTTGTTSARIEYGANELAATVPLALAASNSVPRGNFLPLTKVNQMIAAGNSDPALKDFAVKTQALLNAYNMVAARGGSSVGEREHNATLVTTANSPAAYKAAVDAMMQEVAVAKGASKQTMSDVTGSRAPRTAGPAAASKVIRYDASGNRIG